jgi:hypothetical protein
MEVLDYSHLLAALLFTTLVVVVAAQHLAELVTALVVTVAVAMVDQQEQ